MSESTLSFASSSSFRNTLIARNLAPYQVQGVYTPPAGNVTYEVSPLGNSNVINSPDTLISTNQGANQLYPLNEYGPEGGYLGKYTIPGSPYPVESNKGPYDPGDTILDLVNEFYIDAAYIQNKYGPEAGFKDMLVITDVITSNKFYLPYWDPSVFIPSAYSPYEILTSDNPNGSNGLLSQDSYLAKIGASQLKGYFEDRIAAELEQLTIGSINLDTLSDPFSASLLATGQQPFFIKNWKITVPENPIFAAVSLATRLTGTYFPVSFIPGDYFNEDDPVGNVPNGLNVVNNLTGGALGPILNKYRNPSEVFLANTGNGQQSVLFGNLNYNLYRPQYQKNLIQSVSTAINNLFGGSEGGGGYYVGSVDAEPSQITTPSNEVAVDRFGKQQATPVYGPDELGKLYEGNEGKINFGLASKSYTDGDGIDGKFVWTSPKYRPNAGFKVGRGGETFQQDAEFNIIEAQYNQNQSIDIEYKGGSILDNTQRLINAGDNVAGIKKLKHVGNAINQVSKVFNDGYKEMTKGSQVIAYYDSSTNSTTIGQSGFEVGKEYCRVFQKDTPYLTYADLQKTDGITISGRKFNNSVFDNTYNLNIAPIRNPGSTNIVDNKVKKYMFSLENLAWRTSSQPGFTYDDLPVCEKGPNGGRIMWFPPYDITFSEDSKASWNPTSFLGRPEPIFTYKNSSRSGSISWKIVVDHPSVMNTIVRQQLKSRTPQEVNSILDSFFAGCVKYDLYDLALKFNTIPTSQLYTYQQLLNEPRTTQEEVDLIIGEIPVDNSLGSTSTGGNSTTDENDQQKNDSTTTITSSKTEELPATELAAYLGYAFYFENDSPYFNPDIENPQDPAGWKVAGPLGREQYSTIGAYENYDYQKYYDFYVGLKSVYNSKAPVKCYSTNPDGTKREFLKSDIPNFFTQTVEYNFEIIKTELVQRIKEVIVDGNGQVTIDLVGSASPIQITDYNEYLSDRRIDAVLKWFSGQTVDGTSFAQLIDEQKLIIKTTAEGENIDITSKNKDGSSFSVNCNENIRDNSPTGPVVRYGGEWYSVPAMACRKVTIAAISGKKQVTTIERKTVETDDDNGGDSSVEIDADKDKDKKVIPIKKIPKPDPIQKVKEGISKQILRNLFSECDYFDVLKETDPMVFDSLKDKIKYFNPAFHSITPEGLNARLTFLQQCFRPGETIPVIGPDGTPKHNDALNTAFGSPPVLVLRVGDFYHTKIIPNSLSITYDPLVFDINPEGIGIQPMIAKVSLGFDFIGGHGLAEPVKQLQNALSFNYYANTEIYDERAVATEDTSKRDQDLVAKIVKGKGADTGAVGTNQVANQIPQKGGSTVGAILSTNSQDNNSYETGDIEYKALMTELSDKTQGYFKTVTDQFKTVINVTNYGVLSLVSQDREFSNGEFNEYETAVPNIPLYGKSNSISKGIGKLVKETVKDVKDESDPILINSTNYKEQCGATNAMLRNLKAVIIEEVEKMETVLNDTVITPINTLTTYQEDYNYTLRKLDVICNKLDGIKIGPGEYKVYTLSGDPIDQITKAYTENAAIKLKDFSLLIDPKFITGIYNESNVDFITVAQSLQTEEDRRFYLTMSSIFLDDNKFNNFVQTLTSTDKVKDNAALVTQLQTDLNAIKGKFKTEHDAEVKYIDDFIASEDYKSYETYKIEEFDSKVQYTTEKVGNNIQKKKRLADLYSDVNVNIKNKTYNGKVKFA
jgi:hypothetical protein